MSNNAYAQSGVNVESGYEAVERMKKHIERTNRPEVLSSLGGFGGLFSLAGHQMEKPVLVSGTDGVGTKLILAQQSGILNTVGIDLVAMCANDVLAQGAMPLFFLDYLAVGKNFPEKVEALVEGVANGCVEAGAALIGGETAEMPDLYSEDEFDMAGFCVAIADEKDLLDGSKVETGDVLIGLPSSGIHSNGFSLVRKLFFKDNNWSFETKLEDGRTLIDHLLTPTRIYVKEVQPLLKQKLVKGIAHITGGGFVENIPRMYPAHLTAFVEVQSIETPLIFKKMQEIGNISTSQMYEIFNMGIGMILAVSKDDVEKVLKQVENAVVIGEMKENTTNQLLILNGVEV